MRQRLVSFVLRNKRRTVNSFSIFLSLLFVMSYFYAILKYSVEFPFHDDFYAILNFLNEYLLAENWSDKFALLFKQHNEHRIVFGRAITLLHYKLNGSVNFVSLIVIGNVSLVFILILLYRMASEDVRHRYYLFLPVVVVILNFRYYMLSFWAMASTQNIWVIVFSLASFYCLFKQSRKAFVGAIIFGYIALFTSGNGIMVLLSGVVILFLNYKENKAKALIWTGASLIGILIYFYDYVDPKGHPSFIYVLLERPFDVVIFYLSFLGGGYKNVLLGTFIGSMWIVFALYLIKIKYYKTNPMYSSALLFFFFTAAALTISRSGFGIEQSFSSRYIINSSVFWAVCYLSLVSLFYKKSGFKYFCLLLLGVTITNTVYSYCTGLPVQVRRKQSFDKSIELVKANKVSNFDFGRLSSDKVPARKILEESNQNGVFKFSYNESIEGLISETDTVIEEEKLVSHIDKFDYDTSGTLLIRGWVLIAGVSSLELMKVVCLRDSLGKTVLLNQVYPEVRFDLTYAFSSDNVNYDYSGFSPVIDVKSLPVGRYDIFLLFPRNEGRIELPIGTIIKNENYETVHCNSCL